MSNVAEVSPKRINIPYTPRPFWRDILHPALEKHKRSVVVAHRRFGKTVGSIVHLIKMALLNQLESPQYAYVAPYRYQAKAIAWNYLKKYSAPFNPKINETDLTIEFTEFKQPGSVCGPVIKIGGADNPDTFRGLYFDGVIIDEYAQIKKEVWEEVLQLGLLERDGWAVFIGTPKGINQFSELYYQAQELDDWYTCLYTVEQTGIIPPDKLESVKRTMTDSAIRQELYCDFTASAFNVLIPIDLVERACKKQYREIDIAGQAVILGVDVARYGDDSSIIFRRQGQHVFEPIVFDNINNMELADRVIYEMERWKADAVFVDAGRGEGVIDRIRQLGRIVTEVNFGSRAIKNDKYYNKRSEMWDTMKQWLEKGGSIPNNTKLKQELSAPEYEIEGTGKLKMEPKKKIKERIGASPDLADALALTFAMPVYPKNSYLYNQGAVNPEYDPFKNL